MFELVVVWTDGGKTIYDYETEERAEAGAENMRTAFGNQIAWAGVREKL